MISNYTLHNEHGFATDIEADGKIWRMHDFAEFAGFEYQVPQRKATLSWNYYVPDEDLGVEYRWEKIHITFDRVACFEVCSRDPDMPVEEDNHLDTVSFMYAEEELSEYTHNGVIPCANTTPNPVVANPHILFRFRGGQMVRIGAERSEFVVATLSDEP